MYAVIPSSVAARVALLLLGLITMGFAYLVSDRSFNGFMLAVSASGIPLLVLLYLTFGLSSYWAPWRIVWRMVPMLNRAVFPDINGIWVGETRSNYPVIVRMAQGAWVNDRIDTEALRKVNLQVDQIALEIKASFFGVSICGFVANTSGNSHSLAVRLMRKSTFQMHYLYDQSTPEPLASDESVHSGAASLDIGMDAPMTLVGPYWTRRRWRQGLNTAGQIMLTKRTDKHGDPRAALADPLTSTPAAAATPFPARRTAPS